MMPALDADRGFVLLAVLLVLLVLAAGVAGLAVSAAGVADISAASLRVHEARLAAFSGAHAALEGWSADAVADLGAGSLVTLAEGSLPGGARYAATAERLDERRVLIRARGWVERGGTAGAEWRVGRLVSLACGCDFAEAIGAALEAAGGVRIPAGGVVTAEGTAGVRVDSSTAAGGFEGDLTGDPAIDPSGFSPSGVWEFLGQPADRLESGVVTPAPRSTADGTCDRSAAANWGSPASGHACSSYAPVIRAPSDLRVDGGVGQGVLLADGDVEFTSTTEFRGVVIARGDVLVRHGALVRGAIVATSPTGRVEVAGEVRLDPVDLEDALDAVVRGRAFDPPGRRWIPLF
ncbi:MAG TPA: hypothetical protein VML95_02455 [Longimicrobiales bacterium]|nr:hypothetical protein [Longimicrobiales bacterium]